jgi:DNA polymerase
MKIDKESALKSLYEEYIKTVTDAPVCDNAGGFSFVLGDGDAESPVVLIGEAPGKDEVAEGRPFVGKAGAILNEFLQGAGLKRSELFITNAIKYRLARVGKSGKGLANRPAKSAEIEKGAEYLSRELEIISPRFIVTLGNVPLKALAMCTENDLCQKLSEGVGACHGKAFESAVGETERKKGAVIFPLYHPASTIYNRSLKSVYAEDLEKLSEIIKKST